MINTRRYWDGSRWTEQVAPDDSAPPLLTQTTVPAVSPTDSAPNSSAIAGAPTAVSVRPADKDEPAYAWTLAVLPLAWAAALYAMPQLTEVPITYIVGWVLTGLLASLDAGKLNANAVDAPGWYWAVLLPTRLLDHANNEGWFDASHPHLVVCSAGGVHLRRVHVQRRLEVRQRSRVSADRTVAH